MNELPEAIIEAGAKAYYEWATLNEGEESRWDELGPHQEFARSRARVILAAALSVTSTEGPQLMLGEAVGWTTLEADGALKVYDAAGNPIEPYPTLYRAISPLPIEGDANR